MNNHWHTNYKADQEGATEFRYSIQTHGAFESAAAERFGVERSQPLVVVPVAEGTTVPKPLLALEPPAVIVTSLKPSRDGKAIIVHLFNAAERPATAVLKWREPGPKAVTASNFFDEPGAAVTGGIDLPGWGSVMLRCEQSQ